MGNVQSWSLPTIVGVCYLGLQCLGLLCLSVAGYHYVKTIFTNAVNEQVSAEANDEAKADGETSVEIFKLQKKTPSYLKHSFLRSWLRVSWKMRSVYSSFLVHSFDIATDLIVILEWLNDKNVEHVDSKLMAYFSIGVIVFHKIISSFAIWISEKNLNRAILQLFDVLIYQEIYYGHSKIVTSLKNAKSRKDSSTKGTVRVCLFCFFSEFSGFFWTTVLTQTPKTKTRAKTKHNTYNYRCD